MQTLPRALGQLICPPGGLFGSFFSSLQNKVPSRVFDFKDKKKIENKKYFLQRTKKKIWPTRLSFYRLPEANKTNFLHKVSSRHSAPLRRWRRGRMLCIAIMFYENLHILVFVYFTSVVLGRFCCRPFLFAHYWCTFLILVLCFYPPCLAYKANFFRRRFHVFRAPVFGGRTVTFCGMTFLLRCPPEE